MHTHLRLLSSQPGHKLKLGEITAVLGATAVLFHLLREDMRTFGFFVYGGLCYVVLSAPDVRCSLLTGAMAGAVGAATEYWGCVATGLWNWVDPSYTAGDLPTQSLWMAGGTPQGFPIEVVVAYAGAGFWMASISKVVLAPEHREVAARGRCRPAALFTACRLLLECMLVALAYFEPACLQSGLLAAAGLHALSGLPPSAASATVEWGAIVGCSGFFFEIFATGGLVKSFAVWRYSPSTTAALIQAGALRLPVPFVRTAPLTALLAYFGTGLLIFGTTFQVTAARQGAEKAELRRMARSTAAQAGGKAD